MIRDHTLAKLIRCIQVTILIVPFHWFNSAATPIQRLITHTGFDTQKSDHTLCKQMKQFFLITFLGSKGMNQVINCANNVRFPFSEYFESDSERFVQRSILRSFYILTRVMRITFFGVKLNTQHICYQFFGFCVSSWVARNMGLKPPSSNSDL